jgi:hypothetical protein
VAKDELEAKKLVRESLRRRSSAKRRIGVAYHFRQLIDPKEWFTVRLEMRQSALDPNAGRAE